MSLSKVQILEILKATQIISTDLLKKIEKVLDSYKDTQLAINELIEENLLNDEILEILNNLIEKLKKSIGEYTPSEESFLNLPLNKKKDILFAKKLLEEGINVEIINKSFKEQVETEKKYNKKLSLGQIMVKNHSIPVDTFVKIHREIEELVKKDPTSIDKLILPDKNFRATIKDNCIKVSMGFIPERFGPYKIIEEIAQGGMGVVYKAWDAKLKRVVALKVLKAWENPPMEEVQRFHREARLAASLNHPNIVKIYDAGVVNGVHYFTMDFVEGETLSEYLEKHKPTYRESLIIIREIALALDYAHSHGVIHRDVKPGNIILDVTKRALLTDFGLAKGINTPETRKLTQSGEALGTPAYMSPEQAKGETKIDARSDIYSLGAVLYEMLTGKPPFEGDSVGVVISAVLSKDPIPPSKINPNIHPQIETICLKAMAKNKEERYKTAKEMAEDIDRFLLGESIKAKPVPLIQRIWKKFLDNLKIIIPFVVLLGIFLLILIIIAITNFLNFLDAEEKYKKGIKLIHNNKELEGLKILKETYKSESIYLKVNKKLNSISKNYIKRGKYYIQQYDKKIKLLNKHYCIELERFKKLKNKKDKLESLITLQKIHELRIKNILNNLNKAYKSFFQGIKYAPYNKEGYEGIKEILIRNLKEAEEKGQFFKLYYIVDNINYFNISNKYRLNCKLTIRSKPKADLYLFYIDEIFLRKIPIGWKSYKNFLKNRNVEILKKYLDRKDARLDIESYIGKTPCTLDDLYPGYYLIILEAENHMQVRKIKKITSKEPVFINQILPKYSPLLKNFQYIEFSNRDNNYEYFVGKKEVTFKEYEKFLKDKKTIKKYKRYRKLGEIRYFPRINNKFLSLDELRIQNTPIIGISWQDAISYCIWLGNKKKYKKEKISFELIDQRELEIIEGKEDKREYVWGNIFDPFFFKYDISIYGIENLTTDIKEWGYFISKDNKINPMIYGGDKEDSSVFYKIGYFTTYPKNYTSKKIGFRLLAIRKKKNY